MPDFDIDFDERRRGEVIRYVTDKYGDDRVSMIVTYGTIKAKQAVKDSSRILGYPFAMGDRITKAMPAAVMGKDVPLQEIFNAEHKRFGEGGEFRALYDGDNDVKRVVDTAIGIEGLKRQWGVHAAGVIMSSEPLLDIIPMLKRPADGAMITQFDYPTCEAPRPDQDGLPGAAQPHRPRRRGQEHQDEPRRGRRPRGRSSSPTRRRTSCSSAATPSASSSSTAARCARCCVDEARHVRGHLRRRRALPARSDGRRLPQQVRPPQDRPRAGRGDPPRAGRAARGRPGRDLRPDRLPGAGHGDRPEARGLHASGRPTSCAARWARRRRRSWTSSSPASPRACSERGYSAGRDQDALGHPAAVLRLRLQQGPLGGVRPGVLLDRLPQGQLPGRVHGRAAHLGQGRQGQVRDLPQRVPPDEDPGAPARRQRVGATTSPRSATTSASASPRSATSAATSSTGSSAGREEKGRYERLQRLPGQGRRRWSATSGSSSR